MKNIYYSLCGFLQLFDCLIWFEIVIFAQNCIMFGLSAQKKRDFILLFVTLFLLFCEASAQEFKVIIDAGHGGKDPGAIGAFAKEKDINLGVALALGEMIKQRQSDVKVIYTRDDDFFVELQERANIANRSKAQLFISIHTNSAKSKEARGTETYTMGLRRANENLEVAKRENSVILLEDNYKVKYEGFDPTSSESYIMFELLHDRFIEQSISMASAIQKEFKEANCIDRGVRQDVFLVLRNTGMPSVLIEVGYVSNPTEEEFLKSKSGQQKLASAIYTAFCQFKRNFDNRQGRQVSTPTVNPKQAPIIVDQKEETPDPANTTSTTSDEIIYKVQILASPTKLRRNSAQFKSYKDVDYFEEKGVFKYTYGSTTDVNEINKIKKELSSKFKGCFVVGFKNGEKVVAKY
ncbi:MAG: N-acetylmuramoyl-L-alanine amidase [Bacteroidales bacterium]|nr:N-acetylmuramoyl-L-alanine amidase [Bacteroidales bacterium]